MKLPLKTLKSKIVFIMLASQLITLLIGFSIVAINLHQSNERALVQNSLVQARLISLNAVVPLTFEDSDAIVGILEKVQINDLDAIVVFDSGNEVFAQYRDPRSEGALRFPKSDQEVTFDNDWLYIRETIQDQQMLLGEVVLRISLQSLKATDLKIASFLVALALSLLVLCYFLAIKLQEVISGPILNLTTTSMEVSRTQDYSMRAQEVGSDEIGQLTRNFNNMLSTIMTHEQERQVTNAKLKESKSHLETAIKDLQYTANYDALTRLPNRRLCLVKLKEALQRAQSENQNVALIILDLDHFKDINDSLGHGVGDQLLIGVSQRLAKVLGENDVLARIGGDEFVIILEGISEKRKILDTVEEITTIFESHFDLDGCLVHTGVSVGLCRYPEDGETVDMLMKNADTAMFKAKENGRSTFQFYEPEMNAQILRRINLSNDLRNAIERNELKLVYQPKYRTKDQGISGVEALLRWFHTTAGFISPAEFIPIAENTGLINQIGLWVIREACLAGKRFQANTDGDFTIAVNLSAVQFKQSDLPNLIVDITQETGFPAEKLELELTESAIMTDVDQSIRMLTMLKNKGFSIAIDDFGTGYSSLSYLRRFPLDSLKIDRSFIDEVTNNEDDTTITLTILSMAKALNLKVVAEGVETKEQFDFLALYGCEQVQGFYFSPGIDADALIKLVNENQKALASTGGDK